MGHRLDECSLAKSCCYREPLERLNCLNLKEHAKKTRCLNAHIFWTMNRSPYIVSAPGLRVFQFDFFFSASSKRWKEKKNLHSLAKYWLCFLTQCHWTAFKRWYYLWLLWHTINTIIFPIKSQSELATFESVAHSKRKWLLGSSTKHFVSFVSCSNKG